MSTTETPTFPLSRHADLNRGPTDYESGNSALGDQLSLSNWDIAGQSESGKFTTRSQRDGALLDRLMARVSPEPNTGCWVWVGSACRTGYGTVKVAQKMFLVHRVLFGLLVREPRREFDLDHLCRNRWCVNPWHLEEVTHAVNTRRASKLSSINVERIRELIASGVRRAEVAQQFGVHVVTVGQIVRGDRWGAKEWLRGAS